jgi:hypothetical protein
MDSELEDLHVKLAEASSTPDTAPYFNPNYIHVIENSHLDSGTCFSGAS